ncbi:carboxypeptidase-like regulatory domain-containing protein [Hymenobacter busanensis]|uniref:Carboxypeptidase-like regulatory domain-containing protein n=1 Tax=Hymenobacter busanensis TaxID=2607656 RepID=A0A7L4ZXF8_9BACT|nr:carboxypeptidase-like regulatory domain-containing protein [Hymenobacter busanensis]KAA9333130.1 carboxypeptidase-like regulatory domain-containing protein [Hymenobacter busanensis]QHJ08194.1 hypothetical protein GUY19_13205 [Hymenobacter busanensis]
MRFLLTSALGLLLAFSHAATAQSADPTERIALAQPTATPTAAPMQTVRGQVIDEDGLPLPGATVFVKSTRQVYSTNADGYYTFNVTSNTAQVVQVSMVGYSDVEMTVRRQNANPVTLELLPGTRIKQTGRNKGKIVSIGR